MRNSHSRVSDFLPHKVDHDIRGDGSILLTSSYPLEDYDRNIGEWLHKWSELKPDQVFIAERSGEGWRQVTYQETLERVRALASSLLDRGLNQDTPIAILSGNSVNHALLSLAGQYVGVPIVPLAEQYSLIRGAHNRLQYIFNKVRPSLVYVEDANLYAGAIALEELSETEIVATNTHGRQITAFDDLLRGRHSNLENLRKSVGPDNLARIMFTSGSTSDPKGVCTTQRMICSNQKQIAQIFPFLKDRPPRIVDWLPWNHVFGGGHNFNLVLSNGGSYYIDDGKPTPQDFPKTLRNMKDIAGTWSFNVPVGFGLLVEAFRNDKDLCRNYFSKLEVIVYAGASLPQPIWEGLEQAALAEVGAIPMMVSSWGMTETSPAGLYVHEPIDRSGIVGVPMPGFTAKLLPNDEERYELRAKGPNVISSYYEDEEKTRTAFDEEGFFITGDAVKYVDKSVPDAGLKYDGRISEDFKLLTGTWVQASILRLQAMEYLAPLAHDIVICGQDKNEIGILLFPNPDTVKAYRFEEDQGALTGSELLEDLEKRLLAFANTVTGSSRRIVRAIILASPPSLEHHEMTGKGNLNARKVQETRSKLVERLYSDDDPAVTKI